MELKLKKRQNFSFRAWGRNSNDTIYVVGLDLGGVTTEKHRAGDYAVWHTTGHQGWAGIGDTVYYSPSYYVVKAEVEKEVSFLYKIEANRKTWRKCLIMCIEKVNELKQSEQAI